MKKPKCYGSTEFSPKALICLNCYYYIGCRKIFNDKHAHKRG